jgi:hypothetical protein
MGDRGDEGGGLTAYAWSMSGPAPITPETAARFAESWYGAWNARPNADLEAVMAHYAPDIEHSSPFIARFNGTADPTLRGWRAVREYFGRAIEKSPTPAGGGPGGPFRFNPLHVTVGFDSVVLVYRRFSGEIAAEVFVFDAGGLVLRSISHYG